MRSDLTGADYKEGRGDYYRREGLREYADILRRNGYVVLTAEEAEVVRYHIEVGGHIELKGCDCLALLTPEAGDVIPGYGSSIEQTNEEFIAEQTGGPC